VYADGQVATCVITCESLETLRKLRELLNEYTDLNRTFTRTTRCFPDGVEKRITTSCRLGDYFDRIEWCRNESSADLSCNLVFYIRQRDDSYWKNLIVAVLRSISDGLVGVSVKLITQSI